MAQNCITVSITPEDCDTELVKEALQYNKKFSIKVVAEETDVLVEIIHCVSESN